MASGPRTTNVWLGDRADDLRARAAAAGVSLSEAARLGLEVVLAGHDPAIPLPARVARLEDRVDRLEASGSR